jgi:methylmalonyl-CoA mutase C-terminal domain/subunit
MKVIWRSIMNEKKKRTRILIVKPGMDGHWRGAIVVSMALRDAGMEVIYGGNQPPENIVKIAIQESVDVIGLSIYSAGHIQLTKAVMEQLKKNNVKDILVIVGGTIPKVDIPILKEFGVDEVFLPGTPPEKVAEYIRNRISPIQG